MTLSPQQSLFAFIVFLIAFLTAKGITYTQKIVFPTGRYGNIDGLRGFLALGVFIHHGNIWYSYLKHGIWKAPDSNLYNQFGSTCVSFFFMITSFLFITKLLHSREKGYDWKQFFISRIFRLAPMYYFTLLMMVILLLYASDWELKTSFKTFATSIFHWLAFTITTTKLINGTPLTLVVDANVNWSLPFEWLFYFSLPLVALLILKKRPSWLFLGISIIFVALFIGVHGFELRHLLSFAGGAAAPFLLDNEKIKKVAMSKTVDFMVVLMVIGIFLGFYNADGIICKILICLVFTCIALGSSIFGLLRSNTLKLLGEMCYSTYLLHGLLLFTVFFACIGIPAAASLSAPTYCLVIFAMTPVLVLASWLGFTYVEKPFMDFAKRKRK